MKGTVVYIDQHLGAAHFNVVINMIFNGFKSFSKIKVSFTKMIKMRLTQAYSQMLFNTKRLV